VAPAPLTISQPTVLPGEASSSAERQSGWAFATVLLEWEAEGYTGLASTTKRELLQLVQETGATLDEFSLTRVCAAVGHAEQKAAFRVVAADLATRFVSTLRRAVELTPEPVEGVSVRAAVVPGWTDVHRGADELEQAKAAAGRLIAVAGNWQVLASAALYRGFEGLVDVEPVDGKPEVLALLGCSVGVGEDAGWSSSISAGISSSISGRSSSSGRLVPPRDGFQSHGSAAAARSGTSVGSASVTIPPGMMLGSVEIQGMIGAGGMGEVYRGRDVGLNRYVAVKVMRRDGPISPLTLRRFQREAQALASVNSVNVTQVFALALEGTPPFIVLELVEGPSLREILVERCSLPVAESLDIALQTISGLAVPHEAGLVHRDVNPKNLLIDQAGVVKITDFGLAKLELGTASLSGTGAIVGTPLYISPEQARGLRTDFRTDLYALGVTLFHMLVGRPPFSGRTVAEILTKHVLEPIPRLDAVGIQVAPEVDDLVAWLTAKDPADRPRSYEEVRSVVAELLDRADL